MKNHALRVVSKAVKVVAPAMNRFASLQDGISRPTTRAAFLQGIGGSALEIGPFNNPTLTGRDVSYFDVLDREGLTRRAASIGYDASRVPFISYVSPVGDLSVVDRTFDSVLSSHAIEHQPDLIRHLREVERLLVPGGRYYLIVPDKRYCFDHYIPTSTVTDVREANEAQRRVHTPAAVLAHRLETTHNHPGLHWLGWHGRPRPTPEQSEAARAEAAHAAAGEYVDVHAWTFTPSGFHEIVVALNAEGLIGLRPDCIHETSFGAIEFFAVLAKPGAQATARAEAEN